MAIVDGTINTEAIYSTHRLMREMVTAFNDSKLEVAMITNSVRQNWVGAGRTEFDAQYRTVINKIEDFGESIQEIYNALVDSEKQYEETDVEIAQQFTMINEEATK